MSSITARQRVALREELGELPTPSEFAAARTVRARLEFEAYEAREMAKWWTARLATLRARLAAIQFDDSTPREP